MAVVAGMFELGKFRTQAALGKKAIKQRSYGHVERRWSSSSVPRAEKVTADPGVIPLWLRNDVRVEEC